MAADEAWTEGYQKLWGTEICLSWIHILDQTRIVKNKQTFWLDLFFHSFKKSTISTAFNLDPLM